jgi:hypothetical protein
VLLVPERCDAAEAVRDGWVVRLEDGRIPAEAITDVWVHGRRVLQDGRLTTLDEAALPEDVRALTRDWGGVSF